MNCCVCLIKTPKLPTLNIFGEDGVNLEICNIIEQHLWFKPQPKNAEPEIICYECWEKLKDFHDFYQSVLKLHENHAMSNDGNTSECSIKIEDVDQNEETMEFGIEDQNHLEEISLNVAKCEMAEETINTTEPKRQSLRRLRSKSVSAENQINNLEEEDKNSGIIAKISFQRDGIKKRPKKQRAKAKVLLLENENLIKKHLKMLCDLCPYTGTDFTDLTQHFKEQHPGIKSYIKCCTRKLNCPSDIIQHAQLHEDPNCFMCEECGRTFSNKSGLKDHHLQYHEPEENLNFACDICPRKFARHNLLQHHKSKHVPKDQRSFFCNTCEPPKAFANEYILQIHINSRHRKAPNVCHVCAKAIRSNQSFEKHVRSHFEDSGPRIKCPREDCDSWLKDDENLKQHLRRFHCADQSLECPKCGRFCKSKHCLSNHLKKTHSTEVFTCEECQKTFKSAKSLKEHRASHTGEPLYSCQFCLRSFNSSANMYSHKKKKHPIEWESLCQRNKASR